MCLFEAHFFCVGQCLPFCLHFGSVFIEGVVVNKYGMNQPLTMALKAESKYLKSFHFEIFHAILTLSEPEQVSSH